MNSWQSPELGWLFLIRTVINAFPTLSCILFKLKHSWNTHPTFIL